MSIVFGSDEANHIAKKDRDDDEKKRFNNFWFEWTDIYGGEYEKIAKLDRLKEEMSELEQEIDNYQDSNGDCADLLHQERDLQKQLSAQEKEVAEVEKKIKDDYQKYNGSISKMVDDML